MRNPYNPTKPGNLFVGYGTTLAELRDGLVDDLSYVVLGGRRCGKTSFLLQMANDLGGEQKGELGPYVPIPLYIDIQSLGEFSVSGLFQAMWRMVSDRVGIDGDCVWGENQAYDGFLQCIRRKANFLEKEFGRDWLLVFLVDELDAAVQRLIDDTFFHNLRNLLMVSEFRRHIRMVASGVSSVMDLIHSGSPLNNLVRKDLGVLSEKSAHELVQVGFGDQMPDDVLERLFDETGRHPYLLQALLRKLWDRKNDLQQSSVGIASIEFLREHSDFQKWVDTFGVGGRAVYWVLTREECGQLGMREIRSRVVDEVKPFASDAADVLRHHGVIEDIGYEDIAITGSLFRKWFSERFATVEGVFSKEESARTFTAEIPPSLLPLVERLADLLIAQHLTGTFEDRSILLRGIGTADSLNRSTVNERKDLDLITNQLWNRAKRFDEVHPLWKLTDNAVRYLGGEATSYGQVLVDLRGQMKAVYEEIENVQPDRSEDPKQSR